MLPGAEPFEAAGGPVGVLLCHGFTGSPQTLRSWAEYLAGQGLSVSLPRLPGHGTRWQDLARTGGQDWYTEVDLAFGALAKRCEQTFVFGLSMGGCLALRLAEVHGREVRGLVLVNPSLAPDTKLFLLAPVLKHLLRSLPGIAGRATVVLETISPSMRLFFNTCSARSWPACPKPRSRCARAPTATTSRRLITTRRPSSRAASSSSRTTPRDAGLT